MTALARNEECDDSRHVGFTGQTPTSAHGADDSLAASMLGRNAAAIQQP